MVRRLEVLDQDVARRCAETTRTHAEWPCRAGCSDCCRSLAELPSLTEPEWVRVRKAIAALDDASRAAIDEAVAQRRTLGAHRPIVCPLLDPASGRCRVYEARPLACRTYGFYADREGVLGCHRIAALAERDETIVWGNHEAALRAQDDLGERRSLLAWNDASPR